MLNDLAIWLISTHRIFGVLIVGWEIPLVLVGVIAWSIILFLRTSSLLIATYRKVFYRSKVNNVIERLKEGVTILKPLKGVDELLRDNLESFFNLDYPKYEILFSIAHEKDPSRVVVEELINKYPNVDAKLIISMNQQSYLLDSDASNPKITNLLTSYSRAKYDLIWQNDSNLIVEPYLLKNLVSSLKHNVGIVHQLPLATNPKSLGAFMEMSYLSSWHSIMYLFFNYVVSTHCAVGKSMLFRKNEFDQFGGFKSYSQYLAEDYFISFDYFRTGYKLAIAPDPSFQNLGKVKFCDYWTRQVRWTRIRYSVQPVATFLEVFTMMIPNGLLSFYAAQRLFGISPLLFGSFHLLLWFLMDVLFGLIFYFPPPIAFLSSLSLTTPSKKYYYAIFCTLGEALVGWGTRELLSMFLILHACVGNTVFWRGKTYRIRRGSTLDEPRKIE